jgi:hypothetical protein
MSEVKVNKISPRTNCGTVQLGDSGDTITIPAGATITNNGTQTGFGRTGTVDWDTTAKTASFTAVSGTGYFVNTTSGAVTVTLPASPSAGDIVAVADYAGTVETNNITIARNSSNINGAASDLTISKNNSAITLVYVDGTQGWKGTDTSNLSDIELQPQYIAATGGTITCCGDYKIHTFTGPDTFCVSCAGNVAGSNSVDYLVVAGGAGGSMGSAAGNAGSGAGGLRFSACTWCAPAPVSPLAATAIPVTAQGYPISVGGGGAGKPTSEPSPTRTGNNGSNSSGLGITSTGGGGGGKYQVQGNSGGSGGGTGADLTPVTGGSGNTPPVSPPQGNPGGDGLPCGASDYPTGGGGGAGAAGANAAPGGCGASGDGGIGLQVNIDGNNYYWAGGGGGSSFTNPAASGNGGLGGGGGGSNITGPVGTGGGSALNSGSPGGTASTNGGAGGANTGGGAGGAIQSHTGDSGGGGSGIVIIRYKFQ